MSQIWDEMLVRQNDRNEAQKLLDKIQSDRAYARNAQASQVAPQLWREAERARLAARTALTNGDFAEAKQLALKAKQKYEEAMGTRKRLLRRRKAPIPTESANGKPVSIPRMEDLL